MIKLQQWQGKRKIAVAVAAIAVAALLPTTSALGAPHHRMSEYAQFSQCPLNRKSITDCVYSMTSDGFFAIGKKAVPIQNAVTIQGGFEGEEDKIKFFGAANGSTLSAAEQPVPGGLSGVSAPTWWPVLLQEWFNQGIDKGLTEVNATLELGAPATSIMLNTQNLLLEEGTALGLPVKIRLESPLLGDNCHIGSDEDPIQIDFTTGKDGEVRGAISRPDFNKAFTISSLDGRLVSNSFAVPSASGCGGIFSYFLDPLVDSLLDTPSEAGESSAVLEGKLDDAVANVVRVSQ